MTRFFATMLALLLFGSSALAQTTKLKSAITGSGAAKSESTNFSLKPAIGLSSSGEKTSTNFGLRSFFIGTTTAGAISIPPPAISFDSDNHPTFSDDALEVVLKAEVTSDIALSSVLFFSRQLRSGSDFVSAQADSLSQTGNTRIYSYTVTQGKADDLGMAYYFKAIDEQGNYDSTETAYLYQKLSSNPTIPALSFGGNPENWRMFSIPYQIDSRQVSEIFEALYGTYDNTKWRLVRWNPNKDDFDEVGKGITSIEEGKGYWLNAKEEKSISITNAIAPNVTDDSPKTIILQPGWNQIGNPYPFDVSWSDILSANGDPAEVSSQVKTVTGGASLSSGDNLKSWGGAYVENTGTGSLTLDVPFRPIPAARVKRFHTLTNPINESDWELLINLESGIYANSISRLGMHPEALDARDHYDEGRVPRLGGYLDLNFDIEGKSHSASLRSTKEVETWNFTVENNLENEWVQLTWDNSYFGENLYLLILHDLENERLIDMRAENTYSYRINPQQRFRVYYGTSDDLENKIQPIRPILGHVYPNPFHSGIEIHYTLVSNINPQVVDISVYDMIGQKIGTVLNSSQVGGFYQIPWDSGNLPDGIYLIRMAVKDVTDPSKIIIDTKRIIKQ